MRTSIVLLTSDWLAQFRPGYEGWVQVGRARCLAEQLTVPGDLVVVECDAVEGALAEHLAVLHIVDPRKLLERCAWLVAEIFIASS